MNFIMLKNKACC